MITYIHLKYKNNFVVYYGENCDTVTMGGNLQILTYNLKTKELYIHSTITDTNLKILFTTIYPKANYICKLLDKIFL